MKPRIVSTLAVVTVLCLSNTTPASAQPTTGTTPSDLLQTLKTAAQSLGQLNSYRAEEWFFTSCSTSLSSFAPSTSCVEDRVDIDRSGNVLKSVNAEGGYVWALVDQNAYEFDRVNNDWVPKEAFLSDRSDGISAAVSTDFDSISNLALDGEADRAPGGQPVKVWIISGDGPTIGALPKGYASLPVAHYIWRVGESDGMLYGWSIAQPPIQPGAKVWNILSFNYGPISPFAFTTEGNLPPGALP